MALDEYNKVSVRSSFLKEKEVMGQNSIHQSNSWPNENWVCDTGFPFDTKTSRLVQSVHNSTSLHLLLCGHSGTMDALSEKFSIGHFFSLSLQTGLLLALQTSILYEHPLKLAFLMGVELPSSLPPQPRLTAAADKACPGWWLDHLPLPITPLAHLSSILWSPAGHCSTMSLHTHLPRSLTMSLLSYSLWSSYNQTPHCSDAPSGLWELTCKAISFWFNPSKDPHLQVKPRRNESTTSSANLGNFFSSGVSCSIAFLQRGDILADL